MYIVTPFLWFNTDLQEVVEYYSSIFKDITVTQVSSYMANFEICGQEFIALNGGPEYTFNEAVSFFISCENQEEVDELWEKLTTNGGEAGRCGWLKDKYGLSWQVIPKALGELLGNSDPEVAQKAREAMLKMNKIIIADLA